MTQPVWLTPAMVLGIHQEATARFGGNPTHPCDIVTLKNTLENIKAHYQTNSDETLTSLAAALCTYLVNTVLFHDSRKRTGLLATRAFLFLNGQALEPDEMDEVETMVGVADGSVSQEQLAVWLQAHSKAFD